MPNTSDFIEHVLDLLRPTVRATARPMFGGHGLYVDGIIVAIVVDDTLYFKTDDANRGEFAALGLEPFCYRLKSGALHEMRYYCAPDEALENPSAMARWLRSALGAAMRAATAKPAKRVKKLARRARP